MEWESLLSWHKFPILTAQSQSLSRKQVISLPPHLGTTQIKYRKTVQKSETALKILEGILQ